MKKKYLIIIFILLASAIIYEPRPIYHNLKDRIVWHQMSKHLTVSNISEVEIWGSVSIKANSGTKDKIIRALQKSLFYSSNWKSQGPTPEINIHIRYTDGNQLNFGYWGAGVFETQSDISQFLIMNKDLGNYIESVDKNHIGSSKY